ncbi:UDP-glycosyltransferase 76B1-like [Rhododendron vialii]|uniref:UDP-glycosyltransferase 76B1-like n=1 Tax=Rhododendron vialii TaxID=182163 RepID=UPI00265E2EFA|nr:UDP-glycosyltransferase 76B1-like [Rhododendron vialii]
MENQEKTQMPRTNINRRLVLFPVPLQGHINPMLQLASILHSQGFSITVIHTHFNSPAKSKHPHFTFLPISDGLSPAEASTEDVVSLLTLLNSNCVAPFRDALSGLLAEGPIACLITDAMWHFSQSVSDGFGIPRIVLRTSSVSCFLAFAAFPILRKKGYLPKQGVDSLSSVFSLSVSSFELPLSFSLKLISNLGMVLCIGVHSIVLHPFKLSNRASDGSDIISAMNGSRSLVVKIRSEPSNARFDG